MIEREIARCAYEEHANTSFQEAMTGWLERAQAIFDHGRLVASHSYRQVIAGPGGGDIAKISIRRPVVRRNLAELGQHLNWHGSLSVDYILDAAALTTSTVFRGLLSQSTRC